MQRETEGEVKLPGEGEELGYGGHRRRRVVRGNTTGWQAYGIIERVAVAKICGGETQPRKRQAFRKAMAP